MRCGLFIALLPGCGFIQVVDKSPQYDTATESETGAVAYGYALIRDRSDADPGVTAGVDIEGIELETPAGGTFYATLVYECAYGPGREDEDEVCNAVTGTPGAELVSLGGDGGTLVVAFGGEAIVSGAMITVYEDGHESGELYDIYVGTSTSSSSGSWTTCAAGATGTVTCEAP
jgi:hypothetical protein